MDLCDPKDGGVSNAKFETPPTGAEGSITNGKSE